ncbi:MULTISPECIES: fructose-specific PTS transporter subunit EIIC [unclassified Moraxella]|uniref:fructose-specific PTS transporter subunit EIIC n=1 Tax=unclassified Moraxella TaxID=2685852 RepID=UPI003AF896CD
MQTPIQHLYLISNTTPPTQGLVIAKKLTQLATAQGITVSTFSSAEQLTERLQNDTVNNSLKNTLLLWLGGERVPNITLPNGATALPQRHLGLMNNDALASAFTDLLNDPNPTSQANSANPTALASSATQPLRFVAITACPTGVAHTFMAADALKLGAEKLGYYMDVETQGSVGAKNILSEQAIADADVVILATDIEVNTDRFAGKKIFRTSTGMALKQTNKTFEQAISHAKIEQATAGSIPTATTKSSTSGDSTSIKSTIYKHLMTGVSFMLPIVVAGGLLIAMSFIFGIKAFENEGSLADVLMQTGKAAFTLMIPILSGYIAYSIADRVGLAAGLIGGLLSAQLGAGFLGAIVSGFLAGYIALFLVKKLPLPQTMSALKPILIVPLLSSLAIGLLMFYVVGEPVAYLLNAMQNFLSNMGTTNTVLLGLILGAMMCVDMGGPINKAAYTFSVGLLTLATPNQFPIAAAMAGGMTPAIGMALATWFAKQKFTVEEQNAGKASFVLGLCFISEGAIPFAAKDPSRVIPSCVIGGGLTGALVGLFHITLAAPHGGVFVLLIPNAINAPLLYLLAIAIGSVVTGVTYAVLKPKLVNDKLEV